LFWGRASSRALVGRCWRFELPSGGAGWLHRGRLPLRLERQIEPPALNRPCSSGAPNPMWAPPLSVRLAARRRRFPTGAGGARAPCRGRTGGTASRAPCAWPPPRRPWPWRAVGGCGRAGARQQWGGRLGRAGGVWAGGRAAVGRAAGPGRRWRLGGVWLAGQGGQRQCETGGAGCRG
jgi:hypothetical protein